jgi:hypothetical protein
MTPGPATSTMDYSTDDKARELARLGIRNPNGSKLFRRPKSPQEIAVARAQKQANRERRKAERDRKRDQRRKKR